MKSKNKKVPQSCKIMLITINTSYLHITSHVSTYVLLCNYFSVKLLPGPGIQSYWLLYALVSKHFTVHVRISDPSFLFANGQLTWLLPVQVIIIELLRLIYSHQIDYCSMCYNSLIRKVQETNLGLNMNDTHQVLDYADDINFIDDDIKTHRTCWTSQTVTPISWTP